MARSRRNRNRTRPRGRFDAPSALEKPKRSEGRAPMTEEQQTLALRYTPLARNISGSMGARFPSEAEEFESAAMLALVEAAQAFDPQRGVAFSTFARHRIRGAMRDVQRDMILQGFHCDVEHAPLLQRLNCMLDDEIEEALVMKAGSDATDEMISDEQAETWLRKLPPRYALTCRSLIIEGMEHLEVADANGISRSRLFHLQRLAVAALGDLVQTTLDRYDRRETRAAALIMAEENPTAVAAVLARARAGRSPRCERDDPSVN